MTNEEIMALDDGFFSQTQAFRAFGSKVVFIQKIHDPFLRRKMLGLA